MAKKKKVYPDLNLTCPHCGKTGIRTTQGLQGHIQHVCPALHTSLGAAALPDPAEPVAASTPSRPARTAPKQNVAGLRDEVEMLKLEQERARLLASRQSPRQPQHVADIAEVSGLGVLDAETKKVLQNRALNASVPAESWLDKLLKAPGGLDAIGRAAKGFLGIESGNGHRGDGGLGELANLIQLLGFKDLRSLISSAEGPKAPADFKVGNLSLSGVNLTPELIAFLVSREDKVKEWEFQKERQESLLKGLREIVDNETVHEILDAIKGRLSGEPGNKTRATDIGVEAASRAQDEELGKGPQPDGHEGQPAEPGMYEFPCELCGNITRKPVGELSPGLHVHCETPGCGVEWVVVDEAEEKRKKAKQKAIESPPETIPCQNCGQLLDVSNLDIGASIECPICKEKTTLISQTEPIRPVVAKN